MENEKLKAKILDNNKSSNDEKIKQKTEEIKERETLENKISSVAVLEKENNNNTVDIKKEPEIIQKNPYNKEYIIKKKNKKRKLILATIIIVIIIIIAIALSTVFALMNANNDTILSRISVGNIQVEGLTKEKASELINEAIDVELKNNIELKINEETYYITPEQIEVKYEVEEAVNKAYKIGRESNIFINNFEIVKTLFIDNNIELEITYNEKLLNNILEDLDNKIQNAWIDNTYCIEDDKLIITKGSSGIVINKESAKELIISTIKNRTNETIELETQLKDCPEIDIEKIYAEVKSEPQNASYKKDPFEIIPHKNGIDFDIESAKEILKEEKEEYVIDLEIIEPEIHTNEIGEEAFPDLLSSFSTKYDATNLPRSNNLKIAMSKLDGVVVMPGEVFSYNKTLGKRTVEEGYQNANGFAGGKVVPMLAGGICQISSTLYDAALYANLEIVERHNHMFQATYVEPGKDATVVYGSLDFKFKNTRSNPIMIKTKIGSGLAEIKIFGIKEEVEYDVEVVTTVLSYTSYKVEYQNDTSLSEGQEKVSQYGLQGCKSKTYRILKLNGQEVSSELLSTDTYEPLNKIVRKGVTKTEQTTPKTETQSNTEAKTEQNSTSNEAKEISKEDTKTEKIKNDATEKQQTNTTEKSNTIETNQTNTIEEASTKNINNTTT